MAGPRVHFTRRTIILVRSTSAPYAANNAIVDGTPLTLACDNFGILYTRPAPAGPASPGGGGGVPAQATATSNPGAGVVASATVAASGGIFPYRNLAGSISWSWGDTAAVAAPISIVLRDGATGVGAIIWQKSIGPFPAGTTQHGDIAFNLQGAPMNSATNLAMCLEFTAAPAATGFQSVSLAVAKVS